MRENKYRFCSLNLCKDALVHFNKYIFFKSPALVTLLFIAEDSGSISELPCLVSRSSNSFLMAVFVSVWDWKVLCPDLEVEFPI